MLGRDLRLRRVHRRPMLDRGNAGPRRRSGPSAATRPGLDQVGMRAQSIARPPCCGSRRPPCGRPRQPRAACRGTCAGTPRRRRSSTSSTSRISGSRCAATANASRTYMPLEYRLTGVSMNRSTPEKSTISSKRAAISRRDSPRIEPLRNTFSRPVSSGWKPGPDLEQRADPPAHARCGPSVGVRDPGQQLEQRALAGAVRTDQADDLARLDAQRDVAQRPERLARDRARASVARCGAAPPARP